MSKKIAEIKINDNKKQTLTATCGDNTGEIDLVWEPVESAYSYIIEKSIGMNKPVKWTQMDFAAKSSYTAARLKSGRKYWFRIAAISNQGRGLWSNTVQKIAP